MGICDTSNKKEVLKAENVNCNIIKKEDAFNGDPLMEDETEELLLYKPAICKIKFEILENGEIKEKIGTGFFCKINDKNIPFNKALFTNNHVLNEDRIKINKKIEFEYCEKTKIIKITQNRKVFTNIDLDYTCIEILDEDKINKFFNIEKTIFNDKNSLIDKEIFILQYPKGNLGFDHGKIMNIEKNKIEHSVNTIDGSSGSPLIKRHNINFVIGIHFGAKKIKESDKCNLATPFDIIIKDIIDKLNKNNIFNNNIIKYRNIINLIYYKNNNK